MADIERVASEIMIGCKDLGYDINYFKLQRLLYISNCVHYALYNRPISPAKVFYWKNGGGFKEIYNLFEKKQDLNFLDNNIEDDVIDKLKENICYQSLKENVCYHRGWGFIEQMTVSFVLYKYGDKELNELIKLTLEDSLYQKIYIGDVVDVSKLSNLFITENEQENILDYYRDYWGVEKEGAKETVIQNNKTNVNSKKKSRCRIKGVQ